MKIRNPRTGMYDYEIEILTDAEISEDCNLLRKHQQVWADGGIEKRIEVLQLWKSAVERHKEKLIKTLCVDTGRKWETILEVSLVATSIDRWCSIAKANLIKANQTDSSIPFLKLQQELVPYQLVGVISPWNFPLLLSLIDTIPALLAGCAVIVKPSEVTPRFVKVMEAIINEVPILKNIFKYLEGDGSVGAALIEQCDLICFTGSTTTGKKVYKAASKKMKPVFLELGGKDAAVVLDGADIELAKSSILWGSTANAGQSCLSVERVYAKENIYDEFVKSLVGKTKAIKLNAANINEGEIGSIIFEKQVEIINEQLEDALNKGATIICGNAQCQKIDGGFYCSPTILTNVKHNMKIMQEETFGPIIPIMKFKTNNEAIALANETIYGLSAAVFAKTNEEAIDVGNEIKAGAISINDCALTAIMHEGEKNSFKLSGIGGTKMGASDIKKFTNVKMCQ